MKTVLISETKERFTKSTIQLDITAGTQFATIRSTRPLKLIDGEYLLVNFALPHKGIVTTRQMRVFGQTITRYRGGKPKQYLYELQHWLTDQAEPMYLQQTGIKGLVVNNV